MQKISTEELLDTAQHNEYEEMNDVYPQFGTWRKKKDLWKLHQLLSMIAKSRKMHGDSSENWQSF